MRVRRGDLGTRFAEPEPHLPEQALTLPHPELHVVLPTQVLRQQFAVPQMAAQPELVRPLAQIVLQRRPLRRVQGARPARPLAIAQSVEPPLFERLHPALHRPRVLAEQLRHLAATLAARHQ